MVSKSVGALSRESLETLAAIEASLTNQDTTEADRLNAKNGVEEYIYDIRDKVCGELEDFIKESDRENYSKMLTEFEDWLYDDGEDCEKAVYKAKLDELQKVSHDGIFAENKALKYQFSRLASLARSASTKLRIGSLPSKASG